MANVGSVQGASASILRAADQNTAVVAALLKKTEDADKNLVNTLLPAAGSGTGGLNIKA